MCARPQTPLVEPVEEITIPHWREDGQVTQLAAQATTLEEQIDQLNAAIAQGQAQLPAVHEHFMRSEALHLAGAVEAAEVDSARRRHEQLVADVTTWEEQRRKAEKTLDVVHEALQIAEGRAQEACIAAYQRLLEACDAEEAPVFEAFRRLQSRRAKMVAAAKQAGIVGHLDPTAIKVLPEWVPWLAPTNVAPRRESHHGAHIGKYGRDLAQRVERAS